MKVEKVSFPKRVNLWGIVSDGGKRIWVVGEGGCIYHSGDGGENWEIQYQDEKQWWKGIDRGKDGSLWVVGNRGRIIFSHDDGSHWEKASSGTGNLLNAVYARDAGMAWAVGRAGTMLRVSDGGATVRSMRPGLDGGYLAPASLIAGDMLQPHQRSSSGFMLYSISGGEAGNLWVGGSRGTILRSPDGGSTWTLLRSPTGANIYSVHVFDGESVLVCGARGIVMRTLDGGREWERMESGTTSYLRDIIADGGEVVWVAGWDGVVLMSRDKGLNWETYAIDRAIRFEGIALVDSGVIVVGSQGFIYRLGD